MDQYIVENLKKDVSDLFAHVLNNNGELKVTLSEQPICFKSIKKQSQLEHIFDQLIYLRETGTFSEYFENKKVIDLNINSLVYSKKNSGKFYQSLHQKKNRTEFRGFGTVGNEIIDEIFLSNLNRTVPKKGESFEQNVQQSCCSQILMDYKETFKHLSEHNYFKLELDLLLTVSLLRILPHRKSQASLLTNRLLKIINLFQGEIIAVQFVIGLISSNKKSNHGTK